MMTRISAISLWAFAHDDIEVEEYHVQEIQKVINQKLQ